MELSHARRVSEALRIEAALAVMPADTLLLTYYGLGGPIPGSYERVHAERAGSGWLQVWRRGHAPNECFWLEDGAEALLVNAAQVGRFLAEELREER